MEWVYGISQFAAALLSVITIFLSARLYPRAHHDTAWKVFLGVLIFFAIREVIGAFQTFGFYAMPVVRELSLTIMLAFLILMIVTRLHMRKGLSS